MAAVGSNEYNAAFDRMTEIFSSSCSKDQYMGTLQLTSGFNWFEGLILGRTYVTIQTDVFTWYATDWIWNGTRYEREVSGKARIFLSASDRWDFEDHSGDPLWKNLLEERFPGIIAGEGVPYNLSGVTFSSYYVFSCV